MLKKTVLSLFCCGLLAGTLGAFPAAAASKKKKKAKSEQPAPAPKKTSEYEKLFKEKHETADGMIRLHKVKGKLYFEFPVALLGRDMLLGSTVSEISDNGDAVIGSKPTDPLWIQFTRTGDKVQVRKLVRDNVTDAASPNIARSLANNNIGAIIKSYDIAAWSPDSCAVVFNATDLFLSDNKALTPFDPYGENLYYGRVTRSASYQSDKSFLGEIRAFEDNVVIRSHLSYTYTLKAGSKEIASDVPFTAVMTRSLVLLPETPYEPRFVDSRMSVFPTGKILFSEREQQAKLLCYANRWRVEPSDEAAYRRGELVRPKKPIVFYIDPDFPESWRKPIFEAVEQWNEPFERIGFKQAVEAREFPKDDPEFDPDNIKYSCIRYAPIGISNAMGPSWVDPRSGEIVNASVYVFHDIVKLVNNWRFIQTAQADKSVRSVKLPREVMDDALRYVVTHEVGHCLGFMHNMSASAVIPVDSLRSPSFTQKYGTTTSIMDYARFNYVAQPTDKGVKLTPPELGEYDYYVIKWLYSYLPGDKSAREEAGTLETWVDEKAGDPMYRYGKQQVASRYDPSALEEDLGDDPLKASQYGIKNLQYISSHLNEWITDDPTAEHRKAFYDQIAKQYARYVNNVLYNVGGIYLTEAKDGTKARRFESVPRQRQKESLRWVLKQISSNEWLDNDDICRRFGLNMKYSPEINNALAATLTKLYMNVTLSSFVAGKDPYTVAEFFGDLYTGVWDSAINNRRLTNGDKIVQKAVVKMMGTAASAVGAKKPSSLADGMVSFEEAYAPSVDRILLYGLDEGGQAAQFESELRRIEEEQGSRYVAERLFERNFGYGYAWQNWVRSTVIDEAPVYYLEMMLKVRSLLARRVDTAPVQDRPHYKAMLYAVTQMIDQTDYK